jgi:hypothetical protein
MKPNSVTSNFYLHLHEGNLDVLATEQKQFVATTTGTSKFITFLKTQDQNE